MGLSLTDIRDSGLLELYVLGELAPSQRQQVEEAIRTHPELKNDLADIEQAFKHFAFAKTITPEPRVLENTLKRINSGPTPPLPPQSGGGSSLGGLFGVLALALAGLAGYLWFQADGAKSELATSKTELATTHSKLAAAKIELQECLDKQTSTTTIDDLQLKDNQIVAMTATDKYAGSNIYIYNNASTERNYLALGELQPLPADHAYQLWSLKEGVDPIPLTVFDDSEIIVPVAFEQGTGTYAITIEKEGGAASPTMDRLIGTFAMRG